METIAINIVTTEMEPIIAINRASPENMDMDLVRNILSFAGEFRVLKIKMNKTNIKYLFEKDSNILSYLFNKTSTFSSCYGESVSLELLRILNDKTIKLDMISDTLKNIYNVSDSYYNMLLDILINDYNMYYLNDEYFYNGEWYDGGWYDHDANGNIIWNNPYAYDN